MSPQHHAAALLLFAIAALGGCKDAPPVAAQPDTPRSRAPDTARMDSGTLDAAPEAMRDAAVGRDGGVDAAALGRASCTAAAGGGTLSPQQPVLAREFADRRRSPTWTATACTR